MSILKTSLFSLAVVGLLWSAGVADAGNPQGSETAPPTKPDDEAAKKKDKKKDKKDKKDFPDFKEVVTEDFEVVQVYGDPKLTPFYKLHYNKKTDQLLAEISPGDMGKNVMLSSSIHAAPGLAGWMWGDEVVRWERRNKKLLLIAPDVLNEGKEGTALSDAVRRTYTDRIVKSIDIKTLSGQNPVIDLGDLFKKDYANVGRVFGGSLDSGLAKWLSIKCFESNLVLTVESPYKGKGGMFLGSRASDGTLIAVNYNISAMPDTGYKPRLADDRIGYFLSVRRDWRKDYKQKNIFNRYINRWHLEKLDPSLDKSPVKNPIIFYIEKTVPIRFRNSVKEGILEWNIAFEKCGFLDAMQVLQQTDSNAYKDYDPEDVTKNFFRWTTTGIGLAVGPSRANPLTGQIYDADIVFDDGWIRGPSETHAIFGAKGLVARLNDPKLDLFLKTYPAFDFGLREDRLLPGYGDDVTRMPGLKPDFSQLAPKYSRHMCDYGASVQHELAMAHTVFYSQGYKEIPDKFLQEIVKEVAMHEVGHTLGLRHNFKASTWLPLEDTLSNVDDGRPMSASVMDYNAFMFHGKKELQGDYGMSTIGPYDIWAIEYGYRPVGEPYKSEEELLKSITDKVAEAGLDYSTDDEASLFDPDPLVNRRDMGSDPLEYAKYRIELVEQLIDGMSEWAVDDGESYSILRRRFDRLLGEILSVSIFAGRYVGGQYIHRDHKGDPNARPPFVVVPAAKQREAMKFVSDKIFAGDIFEFEPELLTKLAPGRWGHWGSRDWDSYLEYNLHDRIESIMRVALLPLFNPFTLTRLHDMELMYEADEEAYTLAEHIRSLTNAVWNNVNKSLSKTYSDRDPFISSVRRGLQRAYTQQLEMYLLSPAGWMVPADANALIRMTSEQLYEQLDQIADKSNLDDASRAHLLDVRQRLRKALDAEQVQG